MCAAVWLPLSQLAMSQLVNLDNRTGPYMEVRSGGSGRGIAFGIGFIFNTRPNVADLASVFDYQRVRRSQRPEPWTVLLPLCHTERRWHPAWRASRSDRVWA